MFTKKTKAFINVIKNKKKEIENILGNAFEYYWELEGEDTDFPYYSVVARKELQEDREIAFLLTIHKIMSELSVEIKYVGDYMIYKIPTD